MLADTWYLFGKYWRITMRMPMWTLFTLVQPLIWLLIFGQLFKNMYQASTAPGQHYMDFLVPGILVMTVLFGSSWSGVSLLREINAGTVDKMLVAPVSRAAIVFSRILHSAVQVVVQTLIILLVSWAIGTTINSNPLHLLLGMIIIFLLGISFAAISNGLAIVMQREEPLVAIGNLMTLPLMFFSSALVPASFMPTWIQYVAKINPIDYAVDSVRATMVGAPQLAHYGTGFIVLLVVAAVTLTWAITAFNALRD